MNLTPEGPWLERINQPCDADRRIEKIFNGKIVVFSALSAAEDVVALARKHLQRGFAPHDPMHAHGDLGLQDYRKRMSAQRKAFAEDREAVAAYERMLSDVGLDPSKTYRDRLILRTVPPIPELENDVRTVLPPHRDTWGSGLLTQINWWMPIEPVGADRTMVLYPRYWNKPLKNDSDGWEWRRAREKSYPQLPTATEKFDTSGAIHLVVAPGELVGFSGAHVHASVPNRSAQPRFSTDTRTVTINPENPHRGAPNIDMGDVAPAWEWFHRLGDGAPLSPEMGAYGKNI